MRRQLGGYDSSTAWPLLLTVATIALTIAAFIILWKLGNSTFKNISQISEQEDDINAKHLENTLFLLLGVFFVVSSLVELPSIGISFWVRSSTPVGISIVDFAWPLSMIFQFVIGVILMRNREKFLAVFMGVEGRRFSELEHRESP